MKTLLVEKELPGFLSDRLQEALWREALHIVNEGYAKTEDLDRAIEDGPGLRYSLMGTFLTFHLDRTHRMWFKGSKRTRRKRGR